MKPKQNGYKGYNFDIRESDAESYSREFKFIWLKVTLKSHDWKDILEQEGKEVYDRYLKQIGMFVCVNNMDTKSNYLIKLDTKNIEDDILTQTLKIPIKKEGRYQLKAHFADCYGFLASQSVLLEFN